MNLQRGEIVLAEIGFHQGRGAKLRPAVAVLDTGDDDFDVAPLPSRFRRTACDLTLAAWESAGLNVPLVARINKLSVMTKASVLRVVGKLSDEDLLQLNRMLCNAYCPGSK